MLIVRDVVIGLLYSDRNLLSSKLHCCRVSFNVVEYACCDLARFESYQSQVTSIDDTRWSESWRAKDELILCRFQQVCSGAVKAVGYVGRTICGQILSMGDLPIMKSILSSTFTQLWEAGKRNTSYHLLKIWNVLSEHFRFKGWAPLSTITVSAQD